MLNRTRHIVLRPARRACLLAAWALLALALSPASARPSPAPAAAPLDILSVDSRLLPSAALPAHSLSEFPGDPSPADTATRRFTVRWYANPQASLPAVLLLEFASPTSPGVVRSRLLRLDPRATGFQSASFDVPFPDAIYWQASILSSGRLLSRLQSPNWYEIRSP